MNVTSIVLVVVLLVAWIAWYEWSYNKFRVEKQLPLWKFALIILAGCVVAVPVVVIAYVLVRVS